MVIACCSDADGVGFCSGAARSGAIRIIRLVTGKARCKLLLFIQELVAKQKVRLYAWHVNCTLGQLGGEHVLAAGGDPPLIKLPPSSLFSETMADKMTDWSPSCPNCTPRTRGSRPAQRGEGSRPRDPFVRRAAHVCRSSDKNTSTGLESLRGARGSSVAKAMADRQRALPVTRGVNKQEFGYSPGLYLVIFVPWRPIPPIKPFSLKKNT